MRGWNKLQGQIPQKVGEASMPVRVNSDKHGRPCATWEENFFNGLGGDDCAYRDFCRQIIRPLRAFFGRRIQDRRIDIDDLVQETMAAIHSARGSFKYGYSLPGWIFSIAYHKMCNSLRALSRYDNHRIDVQLENICGDEDVFYEEPQIDVFELLQTLPPKLRLSIFYTKVQGLSIKETSLLIGISETSVKVGVHRGIKALAKQAKKIHVELYASE